MLILRDIILPSLAATIRCAIVSSVCSERFGPALRKILSDESIDERIVRDPNLLNARENAIRRRILALHRGYGTSDNRYLSEFPTTGVTWSRMGLTRDDVCSIRYIDWDYWIELTDGSQLPTDAARRIRDGVAVWGVRHDGPLAVAAGLRRGERFPELILATTGEPAADLVVVEGHVRLTGYVLASDALPDETETIVGVSPAIQNWGCYK